MFDNVTTSQALDSRVSQVMKRVYLKMFFGLLVTALVALWIANTNLLATTQSIYWVLAIVEIGLVLAITAFINKISPLVATLLFYLFAAVNGFTLAFIFQAYAPGAICKTFFITAATFGAMSVYGFFTTRSLAGFGAIMTYVLIGLVIASVVNIFLKSSGLDWVISIVGVLLFIGLTAWDTQQVKEMAAAAPDSSASKLATTGALTLYLDFINLFLFLLRFFGNRD